MTPQDEATVRQARELAIEATQRVVAPALYSTPVVADRYVYQLATMLVELCAIIERQATEMAALRAEADELHAQISAMGIDP